MPSIDGSQGIDECDRLAQNLNRSGHVENNLKYGDTGIPERYSDEFSSGTLRK